MKDFDRATRIRLAHTAGAHRTPLLACPACCHAVRVERTRQERLVRSALMARPAA